MYNASRLNQHFGIEGVLRIIDRVPGYPIIDILNRHSRASVALHGAQVMEFQPHGHAPVLWLSKDAVYAEGRSIRGGIPVCWPWFGKHAQSGMPAHGFVRNRFWQLHSAEQLDNDMTSLVLSTHSDAQSQALWPHAFDLQLTLLIGQTLSLALTMINRDTLPVGITCALHSYFQVGDITEVAVTGLENSEYIDALDGNRRKHQQGAIRFTEELDRIYPAAGAEEVIRDSVLEREIRLRKTGALSTIVWNPWVDKSARMSDFEQDGFRRMVCVESGNAAEDAITLLPGQSQTTAVDISVE